MARTGRKAGSSPRRRARIANTAMLDRSAPKTTRADAQNRREPEADVTTGEKIKRTFDAVPDRVDIRDCFYQPHLSHLPDQVVNCDLVPSILDQGAEGACTGFALAAVINYLLGSRNLKRCVSPRMLYELARRYDEWPGEEYEGSSARGAMKAWVRHGVCEDATWTMKMTGVDHLTKLIEKTYGRTVADEARATPGGAYYRVMHRQVRDMHAALAEVGILYCTLMVHKGWEAPGTENTVTVNYTTSGNLRQRTLPVIVRKGRADGGHAIAIVGYTSQGFVIQNSWGPTWGDSGFALLPYEDYLLHATDVWAMQLGVPVNADLWVEGNAADTTEGMQRANAAVSLADIRPFVVDIGNNGELSGSGNYWTTESDVKRLFLETIPQATKTWKKRRILLYLHGGLNAEASVARRIIAFRDVLLENQIYPVHIMWETGAMESLNAMLADYLTDVDDRAGALNAWLRKFRDGLLDAKDRSLELTLAKPGGALWREMKENARLASRHPKQKGGMQLIAKYAAKALDELGNGAKDELELHVVGHSAGSIFASYALPHLIKLGVAFKSFQLMAPAIRADVFKTEVLPLVKSGDCPPPTLYVLSDVGERDDDVGPYGRSLLYLVSNAFEGKRGTPLVGMERFVSDAAEGPNDNVDAELSALFKNRVDGHPSLVVAGRAEGPASTSRSDTHGGFDNDPDTLNSVLRRVLGGMPKRAFTSRDLQY